MNISVRAVWLASGALACSDAIGFGMRAPLRKLLLRLLQVRILRQPRATTYL